MTARRLLTWPLSVLVIVATVFLGQLILNSEPIGDDLRRPFVHSGSQNEAVDAHDFEITMKSVRGGRTIDNILSTIGTDGVFVLVKVRLCAYDRSTLVGYYDLVDARGNHYTAWNGDASISGHPLQPGIPVEAEMVFELPVVAATGHLTLRATRDRFGDLNERQVMAEIGFDTTAAQVAEWFAETEPLEQLKPEVTT